MENKKYALLSVSDKTGLDRLGTALIELGYTIISTGGTKAYLENMGVQCESVSSLTGFPEILDGRVKTLHPVIHSGLLAKGTESHREEMEKQNLAYIDLVAVNLYPFVKTVESGADEDTVIENIDIGGPTMLRAAAKNFDRVIILTNHEQYVEAVNLMKNGQVTREIRKKWASEAFAHVADYDVNIARYFNDGETFGFMAFNPIKLRYGENPHQKASYYSVPGVFSEARILNGKQLSYNNYVDADSCWKATSSLRENGVVIVKHTNPCGMAEGITALEAYEKALACDPVSAFGGIIGVNGTVDNALAEEIIKGFTEVLMAKNFTEDAIETLKSKKNMRILKMPAKQPVNEQWRSIDGGVLVQDSDEAEDLPEEFTVVTKKQPTEEQLKDLQFAWKVVRYVKSNAIVVAKNGATLGIGAGQMNRVGSSKIALMQAGEKAEGAVMASDAFFPFRDSVDEAAKHGISAIIQPGGSLRDNESIEAADEHGIVMIFTGKRHFRH